MIQTYDHLPDLTAPTDDEAPYMEPTVHTTTVLEGHVIRVEVHDVALPDARQATRELVFHHGGAAVLPIDQAGYVYLVRQYRKAVGTFLTEIPAGKLDSPEDPLKAALRELREETGFTTSQIHTLGTLIPTPGYCTERIYCYLATDLVPGETALDPDEHVTVFRVPFDRALEGVHTGQLQDAKTCYALLMAASRRDLWEVR